MPALLSHKSDLQVRLSYTPPLTAQTHLRPDQRLEVVQIIMQRDADSASQIRRGASDRSPRVCPAEYPWLPYWGDYFGYVGFQRQSDDRWMHLAAYSSDERQGCMSENIWQGRHLHIVATDWLDP